MNRCKYCGDRSPDFSDMCDSCANIEAECQEHTEEMKQEISEAIKKIVEDYGDVLERLGEI